MTYSPTAVYLLRNNWSQSNYKIGISNYPDRRVFEVSNNYENVDPKVVCTGWFPTRKAALKAETKWHRYFSDMNTDDHGGKEWFSLSFDDLTLFRNWTKQSKDPQELRLWLFNQAASRSDVKLYTTALTASIPCQPYINLIDVWMSPTYFNLLTT